MITFLGQGRMGVPMARRLVDAGHQVTVWRRGSSMSPAEAVAEATIVITMLRDPAAVLEVLGSALPGLRPGATVVEMSTIGPEAVAELRELLPESVSLVDAPVLGSVGPAAEGTLTVLAGGLAGGLTGGQAGGLVGEVLSVFGAVRETGPLGSGAALKVAAMSALVPAQVLLAETFAYGQAHGVSREALLEVLAGTPLGALAERLRVVSPETRYALGLAAKDLGLAAWAGGSLASAARARLEQAVAAGLGDRDLTAILDHVQGSAPRAPRPPRVVAINPPTVPATNGRYSHAVRAGDTLYVAGQVALDAEGQVVGEGDMVKQTEFVYENLSRILADQGATFADVAFVRTHLTDISLIAEHGSVRARFFTGTPPASTSVEVPNLFRPGLMCEVDLIVSLRG